MINAHEVHAGVNAQNVSFVNVINISAFNGSDAATNCRAETAEERCLSAARRQTIQPHYLALRRRNAERCVCGERVGKMMDGPKRQRRIIFEENNEFTSGSNDLERRFAVFKIMFIMLIPSKRQHPSLLQNPSGLRGGYSLKVIGYWAKPLVAYGLS